MISEKPAPETGRTYRGKSATQRAHSRRQKLIAAAWASIAESGVAALTAEEVCRRAGLNKRYFYSEFSSKDELLYTCADEIYVRLRNAVAAAFNAATPAMRIRALPRTVVQILASDPGAARLYAESPGFPGLRERQQRAIADFATRLQLTATPAEDDRRLDDGAPRFDLAARILTAGSTEVIIAWIRGEITCDEDALVATISNLAESAQLA